MIKDISLSDVAFAKRSWFLFFVFLFIFSFSLSNCAKKIPQAELDAAKQALERAKSIGADKLEEYKTAEKYYNDAQSLVKEKKYDEAKTKAIVSKEFAELAIKRWQEELERRKKEEAQAPKEKVEIQEEELTYGKPELPVLKGINPDDIEGTSTLGRGYILKQLRKIYFDFDSYSLTDKAKADIEYNVSVLKKILEENPNVSVLIEGHCDERGSNEYNLELGWKRAQAIKRYVELMGIPEDRIQTVSFGEEFPEAPCPPPQCNDESKWSKNRRGVFVITVK